MKRLMHIHLLVEEEKVGGIIADLTGRAQVAGIGTAVDLPFQKNKPTKATKKPAAKKRKRKARGSKSGREIVIAALHDEKLRPRDVGKALEKSGLHPNGVGPLLKLLIEQGVVRRYADGLYGLTAAGSVN